jgi:hypothetical protein
VFSQRHHDWIPVTIKIRETTEPAANRSKNESTKSIDGVATNHQLHSKCNISNIALKSFAVLLTATFTTYSLELLAQRQLDWTSVTIQIQTTIGAARLRLGDFLALTDHTVLTAIYPSSMKGLRGQREGVK